MSAVATAPPSPPKRQRLVRTERGIRASELWPLPGIGEQRQHSTRMALRFAVYGNVPIQERMLDSVAKKFGIARTVLEEAWKVDGIEAKQAEQLGLVPQTARLHASSGLVLGSVEAGRTEARERERQTERLKTRRDTINATLDSLPARITLLSSKLSETDDPDSLASISQAIDSANREASKLVTELKVLNAMIAEATGLDVIQSLSLAAAKAQALKPQAPREQERETRGVVVEL